MNTTVPPKMWVVSCAWISRHPYHDEPKRFYENKTFMSTKKGNRPASMNKHLAWMKRLDDYRNGSIIEIREIDLTNIEPGEIIESKGV